VRRVAYLLVCFAGYFVALCIANRPRFWWQEVLCSRALYWLPFAFAAVWFLVRGVVREGAERAWLRGGALACFVYAIAFALWKIVPYVYYSHWSSVADDSGARMRGIWVDSWSAADRVAELGRTITSKQPSVVMIAGIAPNDALRDPLFETFPYRARTATVDPVDGELPSIAIASKIPFAAGSIDQLGLEALPGGVFPLQLSNSAVLELGVMALMPSDSQAAFERNRITSRRLSSLMRNSKAPRVVAAQFYTTPFSQFMAVYPEQTKMRSLMYGIGLYKTVDMNNPLSNSTESNVFVSRDITRLEFERIRIRGRARAMLYFQVQLREVIVGH